MMLADHVQPRRIIRCINRNAMLLVSAISQVGAGGGRRRRQQRMIRVNVIQLLQIVVIQLVRVDRVGVGIGHANTILIIRDQCGRTVIGQLVVIGAVQLLHILGTGVNILLQQLARIERVMAEQRLPLLAPQSVLQRWVIAI